MKLNKNKLKLSALLLINLILFMALNMSFVTLAYIGVKLEEQTISNMDIRLLFGRLDSSANPSGPWGSDTNPYLISENQHLLNLYVLQNRSTNKLITKDSVFQVSKTSGKPVYIGGESSTSLLNINSIGSEEFPFVSTFRGVKTTTVDDYVTLETGEKSDTSVIGNIRVNAQPTQSDIGLFGNVGPFIQPEEGTLGSISTLLLSDIEIVTSSIGGYNPNHSHFVTTGNEETNHIGILVGHAQYASIKDISVYYSGPNGNPTIKAFNIQNVAGGSAAAKYATATGIVGYYRDLVVNDEEQPVTSDGFPQDVGGNQQGLGLGVVYSRDLWEFMEQKTNVGNPAPNDSYALQDYFGTELYGTNNSTKKYFQIGLFTFAHSMQVTTKDSISKLWTTTNSNQWSINKNNNYSNASVTQSVVAKTYAVTRITNESMLNQTTAQQTHQLSAALANASTYRYMITVEIGTSEYILVRNGAVASPKKIDRNPDSITIPQSELEYYTFDNYYKQIDNPDVPPYESDGKELTDKRSQALYFEASNDSDSRTMQYLGYGKNITTGVVIKEIPRPLRILYQNPGTSTSFMASSTTTGNTEGVRLLPATTNGVVNIRGTYGYSSTRPNANSYNLFILQRRFKTGTTSSSYLSFTVAGGFTAVNSATTATRVKLYAVNYASPQNATYNKQIYTPTNDSNLTTYNTEQNVLMYTGEPTSTNIDNKYRYKITSISSLDWSDNDGDAIQTGDKAIKMSSPTSYYYLNKKFWGVTQDIPNPGEDGTINVPEGSIGFTVQGGTSGTRAKVYVIVATDPYQDMDQTITISRFGTGINQLSDRTVVSNYTDNSVNPSVTYYGQFVLPAVPAASAALTTPISVTENGTTFYTAYPNYNTLLVGYVFSVPVETVSITYFLEASQGSASFVYLSAERSASRDNNPNHENDVNFSALESIDYVVKGTNNVIATVNSTEYTRSLTSPYFGVTRNPNNLDGSNESIDALIVPITVTYNFTYAINRAYNATDLKYYIYIQIVVSAPASVTGTTNAILTTIMSNYNFNFAEWSYLDQTNYTFVYSDVVVITINGTTLDWAIHYTGN